MRPKIQVGLQNWAFYSFVVGLKKLTKGRERGMKKFLTMSLALMSAVIFVPSAQAKVAPANNLVEYNAEPQIRVQIGPNRRQDRRQRVVTQTRDVRRGRNWYRETYQITYLPNGRTQTRVINRVRIR
jgi:hypothetical protein